MRLALYQPDIPQNAGTILRLAACLDVPVDIIGPAGFDVSDSRLRRAALDYLAHVTIAHHLSFGAFEDWRRSGGFRLVLLSTRGKTPYTQFAFDDKDVLLLGRESAGVPPEIFACADASVRIPMKPHLRSINVAVAAAMALGEAFRQTGGFESFVNVTAGQKSEEDR